MRNKLIVAISMCVFCCADSNPSAVDMSSSLDMSADMYDPYPDVDAQGLTGEERMALCLGADNKRDCDVLTEKSVGCNYPSSFTNVCIKDGVCVVEDVPGYCVFGGRNNNDVDTPSSVTYRTTDRGAEAMFFYETISLVGWETCAGPKEGAPEVCKCAVEAEARVMGTCP